MRHIKSREEILINSVKRQYLEFADFVENPGRRGYLGILCKLKPQAKELIKAQLLDNKIEIDRDLSYIRYKMRSVIEKYEEKYHPE